MALVSQPKIFPLAIEPAGPSLKVMMFPLGFLLAHVGRLVEIGKALRERGHEVVFAGDWPRHPRSRLDLAANEGFPVRPMPEPDHPYAWDRFQRYGWMASAIDLIRLSHWAPLDKILDAQVKLIHDEQPDVLVCDASVTTSAASYISGVPAAGVLNAYATRLISAGSLFPIVHIWNALYLERFRRPVYAKYGVEPRNAIGLLKDMPLLSPDLESLYEQPASWPNCHTIGPIIAEPSNNLPGWFDQLNDGRTNIYITMGSSGFLDTLLRQCYDAFGRSPYRFIVTTAGQVRPETEAIAPRNFLFSKYAPGSKILAKCRAMIYHGGNGSMYQALMAGVPMIAVPSHLEQGLCADLCVKLGYGLKLPVRKAHGPQLLAMLEELVSNPAHRAAARKFSPVVAESNGAAAAADFVEKLARPSLRAVREAVR